MRIDRLAYNVTSNNQELIPVVVQDHITQEVLMLAYANARAIKETVKTGYAHYWSRSRKELWKKGQTSGNVQRVVEVLVDCDRDALLYRVKQTGFACHLGRRSCFYPWLQETRRKVSSRRAFGAVADSSRSYVKKRLQRSQ